MYVDRLFVMHRHGIVAIHLHWLSFLGNGFSMDTGAHQPEQLAELRSLPLSSATEVSGEWGKAGLSGRAPQRMKCNLFCLFQMSFLLVSAGACVVGNAVAGPSIVVLTLQGEGSILSSNYLSDLVTSTRAL